VPLVELLVSPGTSDAIASLAAELSRWADVRAPDPALPRPAARLASTPDAPGVDAALDDPGCPVAVVVPSAELALAHRAKLERAAVVLAPGGVDMVDLVAAGLPERLIVPLPPGRGAAASHRPLTPFVRSRWRQRLGFPPGYVASIGFDGDGDGDGDSAGDAGLDPDLVPTALTLAAAVAARGRALELALALGTPVVTDRASAAALGLAAGRDALVVDDPADRRDALDVLARDPARCASLSRAGRRAADRLDLASVASEVAGGLGLLAAVGAGPDDRSTGGCPSSVRHRLDELRTPVDAAIRQRVEQRGRDLSAGRAGGARPVAGVPA
jgi:hypothetical protein